VESEGNHKLYDWLGSQFGITLATNLGNLPCGITLPICHCILKSRNVYISF